jgi:S-adenosylmethionine:tRNA ribosyltransferase-isomerase
MQEHVMHEEWMEVSYQTIENILGNLYHTIVALGTTSLRTIESLYWMGVKTILNPEGKDLKITQWQVYDEPLVSVSFTPEEALVALLNWMKKKGLEKINFPTQILIAPGYSFKIVNAIITNFHQPQSTLLLLVAAATGQNWKQIYSYALQQNFRFLSYGDGNLLFIQQK